MTLLTRLRRFRSLRKRRPRPSRTDRKLSTEPAIKRVEPGSAKSLNAVSPKPETPVAEKVEAAAPVAAPVAAAVTDQDIQENFNCFVPMSEIGDMTNATNYFDALDSSESVHSPSDTSATSPDDTQTSVSSVDEINHQPQKFYNQAVATRSARDSSYFTANSYADHEQPIYGMNQARSLTPSADVSSGETIVQVDDGLNSWGLPKIFFEDECYNSPGSIEGSHCTALDGDLSSLPFGPLELIAKLELTESQKLLMKMLTVTYFVRVLRKFNVTPARYQPIDYNCDNAIVTPVWF